MDMPPALQPLTVDVYFMNLIMNFLLGQHVTLDIVMLPFGALPPQCRPPTLPESWSHPQTTLVRNYLRQFQDQWPMQVRGHMMDRYTFRIMFRHLTFAPLIRYGAVDRFWMRMTLQKARQLAHINLHVSRSLPASYQWVDTIVWHDSESDLHSQTDCEILCTLKCLFAKSPLSPL